RGGGGHGGGGGPPERDGAASLGDWPRALLRVCLFERGLKRKGAAAWPPPKILAPPRQCPPGTCAPAPHTYMQENRNSHTTSTKCQYQAANSKPRCCVGVNCPAIARTKHTIRKIEPTMTWNP